MTIETSLEVSQTRKRHVRPQSPELLVGLVLISDILLVFLAGLLAPALSVTPEASVSTSHAGVVLIAAGFSGALFFALGCYRHEFLFSPIPRVRSVLAAWLVILLLLSAVAGSIAGWSAPPQWMLWWAGIGAGLFAAAVTFRALA